jgi:hypothetical protein
MSVTITPHASKAHVSCLLDCFKEHVNMHSDVIYTQNP